LYSPQTAHANGTPRMPSNDQRSIPHTCSTLSYDNLRRNPAEGKHRASNKLIMDRIATLNEILTENASDAFARYGLAMEYSKQGDLDRALAEFSILLEKNPDYTAGYFMAAQTLARAQRVEDARKMLADGIASARRTGNLHAQSEMEAMLTDLG
jgi:predicted Zn-dependent protease